MNSGSVVSLLHVSNSSPRKCFCNARLRITVPPRAIIDPTAPADLSIWCTNHRARITEESVILGGGLSFHSSAALHSLEKASKISGNINLIANAMGREWLTMEVRKMQTHPTVSLGMEL